MISRQTHSWLVLGLAAMTLGGCGRGDDSSRAEARYRITVEVETPEGVKSGSSVWSQSIHEFPFPLPGGGGSHRYGGGSRGEAVAVDLPNGQTLFLPANQQPVIQAYFPELAVIGPDGVADPVATLAAIGSSGESKILPCTPHSFKAWNAGRSDRDQLSEQNKRLYCPNLVALREANDPLTFAPVNPDDLARSFGKGYRLRAITLQITNDPVTTQVKRRLDEGFWKKLSLFQKKISHCTVYDHPYFRQFAGTVKEFDFVGFGSSEKRSLSGNEKKERSAILTKHQVVSCENLIPGWTGGKLRRLNEKPVFSYKPPTSADEPENTKIARWTPRAVAKHSYASGQLFIKDGCLALYRGKLPVLLLVFPHGEGAWKPSTRTLEYGGRRYPFGSYVSLNGDVAEIFVNGGKPDFETEAAEQLGKYDFHKCNGYDMLLVDPLSKQELWDAP